MSILSISLLATLTYLTTAQTSGRGSANDGDPVLLLIDNDTNPTAILATSFATPTFTVTPVTSYLSSYNASAFIAAFDSSLLSALDSLGPSTDSDPRTLSTRLLIPTLETTSVTHMQVSPTDPAGNKSSAVPTTILPPTIFPATTAPISPLPPITVHNGAGEVEAGALMYELVGFWLFLLFNGCL